MAINGASMMSRWFLRERRQGRQANAANASAARNRLLCIEKRLMREIITPVPHFERDTPAPAPPIDAGTLSSPR